MKDKNNLAEKAAAFIAHVMELNRKAAAIAKENMDRDPLRQ